ncbi:hypothetical protein MHU86_14399 [Fragilaria crotonensis]|nr:hypothetical protein MHU86_14399 [Fragilaria crotonensis]
MAEAIVAIEGIPFVLQTIGFNADEINGVMEAGLAEFEDFRYLVEKDIRDMADEFGKRSVAQGRIVFGLGRTKKLTGVMHWVQDRFRANDVPSHEDFNEPALFEALSLAQIRKSDIDLVDTNTKAANPGKFKDERKWPEWEKSFINYLSVIPGVSGIPLSYIVRDEEFPAEGLIYANFNDRMINRAPLTGQYYIADARRVHNLLVGFLQGENTENWIRNIARYQDGRRDMIALRRHYAGEGNSTRRIADAKRLQASLHYKTERALPFNKFLDSLQKMFTIFEDENEPLTERAKVDELLSKVQATTLGAAVAQLRYQLNTVGVTFTVAANHLNAEISQTSDYQLARKISAVGTGDGRGNSTGGRGRGGRGGRTGGRGRGGRSGRGNNSKASTGYYSAAEWEKLSYEERDKIRKERDKKGEQGGSKRNISELTTKQLTTALISSLQKVSESDDATEKAETPQKSNQAGNAFGGREGAKRQKNSE